MDEFRAKAREMGIPEMDTYVDTLLRLAPVDVVREVLGGEDATSPGGSQVATTDLVVARGSRNIQGPVFNAGTQAGQSWELTL